MKSLIILCMVMGLADPLWAAEDSKDLKPTALITEVLGKLNLRPVREKDWVSGHPGRPLFVNDLLRTGDASKAAIAFIDGTQVRIKANTDLVIQTREKKGGIVNFLKMSIGQIRVKTKKTTGFGVETPSAVATVKGTIFDLLVEEDGKTILTVFENEVIFSNPYGEVIVGPYEQSEAEVGRPPTPPEEVSPETKVLRLEVGTEEGPKELELIYQKREE